MIYRKWSLLTGPAAIFGGIVAAVVIADILFVEKCWIGVIITPPVALVIRLSGDLFRKPAQKKLDAPPATK